MIRARCKKCGSLLFEVDDFQAFHKPSPVDIACSGCDMVYRVSQTRGKKVVLTVKDGFKPLFVEHYG